MERIGPGVVHISWQPEMIGNQALFRYSYPCDGCDEPTLNK